MPHYINEEKNPTCKKEEATFSDKAGMREYYITEEILRFENRKLWEKLTRIGYEKRR